MAILSVRKPVLVWLFVSVAVALVIVLYVLVRQPPAPRRVLYLIGNAEKGELCSMATSRAAYVIP